MNYPRILLIIVLLSLGGCAGRHSIPPHDFAYAPAPKLDTIRVAFDQDGSLYPVYPADGLYTAKPLSLNCYYNPFYTWFKGCAWRIHELTSFTRKGFEGYKFFDTNEAIRDSIVYRLNTSLAKTGRLVVKIHGFNNNFDDANKNFGRFDRRMTEFDSTVLEVHWDGLEKAIPLTIWDNALIYSNMAGQIGLRGILNRIDVPYDLVFVTHSRGAAVAISAISEPINDDRCSPQHDDADYTKLCAGYFDDSILSVDEYPRFEPLNTQYIQSINAVMIAPAIGNGHFHSGLNKYLSNFDNINFYIGVNKWDFATTKLVAPGAFGDTRLGNDQDFIDDVKDMLATSMPNIHLQELWFDSGLYHGVPIILMKKMGKDQSV